MRGRLAALARALPLALGADRAAAAAAAAARRGRARSHPRRSLRCPTLASIGPTSNAKDSDAGAGGRRQARPRRRRQTDENQRDPLHGRGRGPDADRRFRRSARRRSGSSRRSKPTARTRPTPRRSAAARSADADLLDRAAAQPGLLRCGGRAADRARTATRLRVILTADPGPQYRFASVELPGLEAAGEDAAKLRNAFAVKAGDPVIAQDVIAGGVALTTGARRGGLRRSEDRRAGHRGQSPDPSRDADAAGEPGSGRALRRDPRQRPAAVQRAPRRDHRPVQARRPVQALEDRRSAPRADRDDPGRRTPTSRSSRSTAAGRSTSTVRLEPAPSHTIAGELGYGTGQGARARGELDRPQLLQSRRRADRCAASPAPASSWPASSSAAVELPAARPDAEPAGLRVAPEVRRL